MDRRSFLLLAGALGLAGCTGQPGEPEPPGVETALPRPTELPEGAEADARIRAEAASAELALIALYREALVATPARAGRLQPLLEQHVEHLTRVRPGTPVPEAGQPTDGAAATGNPSPGAGARAARDPVGLRALIAAEIAAQEQHAAGCQAAQDPTLVRDLLLLSASEAQHAATLRQLRGAAGST